MVARVNPVTYLLLALLAVFVLYRGVFPGFRQVDSDFPNYYTAAKIVADGKDVNRLYDDSWFQSQIRSYGMQLQGKFSPFPPVTALVCLPLTFFEPLTALRISVVMNLGLLVLSVIALARLLPCSPVQSAVFALLAGIGLANCLRLGQLYILVSTLMTLGYLAYTKKQPVLAGILLGLFVPIKYFPVIFLAYFAFRREWKLAVAGLLTALLVGLLGVAVLGWNIHKEFISIAGGHLLSRYSLQNPFAPEFQSWDALLRRLFVFDTTLNPNPLIASSELFDAAKALILFSLAFFGIRSLVIVHRLRDSNAEWLALGVLGLLGLLLAPGTATYHFVLLWLPLALLLRYYQVRGQRGVVFSLVGLYAAMGFIPYSFTRQFDGRGVMTLLAYPRLMLLLAMFAVSVYFVRNKVAPGNVT